MAIQLQPTETNIWRIVQAIIQLVQGRQNSTGDAVLATGQTQTTVSFVNCSKGCRVFLQAQNAAAISAQPTVAPADIGQSFFVIRHAAAASGASVSFACIGG